MKNIRIICAPNAFKESVSAKNAALAMQRGIAKAAAGFPSLKVSSVCVPLADGGDSTLDVLMDNVGGRKIEVECLDPLGRNIRAEYGLIQKREEAPKAVIEMSRASGLALLEVGERNPMLTSTFGTGQLLAHAVQQSQAKSVLFCLGGSATNDGGVGLATAIGYKFFDISGEEIRFPRGEDLPNIVRIEAPVDNIMRHVEVEVACDVDNPLLGLRGATNIYSGQKGASQESKIVLEQGLLNISQLFKRNLNKDVADVPGAGAAGGLGAGLMAFFNAKLKPGFQLVAEAVELDTHLQSADLVLTGEGALDASTDSGKVPAGVAAQCAAHQVPCFAICGCISFKEFQCIPGLRAAFAICNGPITLKESKENAVELITSATAQAIGAFLSGCLVLDAKEELK